MDFIFAQTQTAQGGGLLSFLPFLLIMVILYFFMLRPQAKKQKDKELMIANLSKGDNGKERWRSWSGNYSTGAVEVGAQGAHMRTQYLSIAT